jgi:hypothetical protein
MKRLVLIVLLLASVGFDAAAIERVNFAFATSEQGKASLTARDDYVQRLSPFDRAAKMKQTKPVSEDEYLALVGRHALNWSEDEKKDLTPVLADVAERVNALRLNWPETVYLVRTTGEEEDNAAYTRANAIFLPPAQLQGRAKENLRSLIAHELFHVLSRHNPELRAKLYASIGYQACGELALPAQLARVKITNPDAPINQHCIRVSVGGEPTWVMPILYSRAETFDPAVGRGFFAFLMFRFVRVDTRSDAAGATVYAIAENPQLLEPDQLGGFAEQIGRNTGYIIHPEETLADNFSLMVMEKTGLPSPEVIAKMREILVAAK